MRNYLRLYSSCSSNSIFGYPIPLYRNCRNLYSIYNKKVLCKKQLLRYSQKSNVDDNVNKNENENEISDEILQKNSNLTSIQGTFIKNGRQIVNDNVFYINESLEEHPEKKYYITSPIFYINGPPHIGHLYTMTLTDAISRWNSLSRNSPSFLLTGTDEHGMKIQQAAEKANLKPDIYSEKASQMFKNVADKANISYSRFIRTTDPDHKIAVNYLWNTLMKNGYIYKGKHSGWYCVSDETFYPESQLEDRLNPETNEIEKFSKESGKQAFWTEEENYFFALSKLRPKLLKWLHSSACNIVPAVRWDEILRTVSLGLDDLSVSRPRARLSWGIPVPGDDSQTIYVWLDALVNYITATQYPTKWSSSTTENDNNLKMIANSWPANVHVIGKDIVRFHCIYWPAFLLAAGLPLPRRILVHSHWIQQGAKMSKSTGNVVDAFQILEKFQADPVRYFFLVESTIANDNSFSYDALVQRHDSDLSNKLGNLVSRVCNKHFNLHESIRAKFDPQIQSSIAEPYAQYKNQFLINEINEIYQRMDAYMNHFETAKAVRNLILTVVDEANNFLESSAPWSLKSENDKHIRNQIIFDAAEAARVAGILLQPFVPTIAGRILDRLAVLPENRSVQYAHYGADNSYGVNAARSGDIPVPSLARKLYTSTNKLPQTNTKSQNEKKQN